MAGKNGKKAIKKVVEREVKYPDLEAKVFAGTDALTVAGAKEILAWEEEGDGEGAVKFEESIPAGLVTFAGKKVRCKNNAHNRPFDLAWSKTLAQEILNKRFAPKGPNGETVIIGRTGQVLSAQHRLVGLVLAGELWHSEKQHYHWEEYWPTEPTLETFVVYGVDESSETTRTLDNVRPRKLSDVLYTEEAFQKMSPSDRKKVCRATEHCVRLLWHRTHADQDAFAPKMTHSEALDFLSRHKRVLEAVAHMVGEDADGLVSKILPPSYAAALFYLMAASNTDGNVYKNMETRSEKKINFDNWELAEEFWRGMTSLTSFEPIRLARRPQEGDLVKGKAVERTGRVFGSNSGSTLQEKLAVLLKAWGVFVNKEDFTARSIQALYHLETTKNQDDQDVATNIVLGEILDLGGIDFGEPSKEAEETEEGENETPTTPAAEGENGEPADPTPEELEQRKEEEKAARAKKIREAADRRKAAKELGKATEAATA